MGNSRILSIFVTLLVSLASMGAHAQLRVSPASPAEGSTVTIYGMTGCMNEPYGYSLETGNASVPPYVGVIKFYDPGYLDAPLLTCPKVKKAHISVGPLRAGLYRIERSYYKNRPTDSGVETMDFEVVKRENRTFPAELNGLWWSTSEPGWGISIYRDPSTGHVFAAWYTHDSNAGIAYPVWIVASNMTMEGEHPDYAAFIQVGLKGQLHKALANRGQLETGNPFQIVSASPVGSMRIDFSSTTEAVMTYKLDNQFLGPTNGLPPALQRQGTIKLEKSAF